MLRTPERKSVLIVEDDADIRESVSDFLSMEGYTVIEARNGQEGLHQLGQIQRPCIILLDMMMPIMDGAEFLLRLAADPAHSACTVLIMTASPVQLPAGAVALLRKPFSITDLLELVSRHCG